jgi:hypothetical protein
MDEQQEAEFQRMQTWSTRPTTPKTAFYAGGEETAYGRRKRRMQEDWDKRHAMMMEEEKMAQQMAEFERQQERAARQDAREEYRYNKEIEADLAKSRKDLEIEKQGMAFASGLRQLDPTSPNYPIERTKLYDDNPLAFADPNIRKLTNEYDEINRIYQDRDEKKAQEAEVAEKEAKAAEGLRNQQLAKLTKLAIQTNRNLSQLVQSDIETGDLIIDPVAVGEAEAELATKPAADPNAPTYRREGAKLREQLRQLDSKIIANRLDAQNAKTDTNRSEFEQNATVLEAQRNLLYSEYVGVQELLRESGEAAPTPAADATDAQIESAKRIAQDPNHPRNASAVEFLRANNIEAESATPTTAPQQPQAAPQTTTTPIAPTTGLRPPTEPQAPQPITTPTPAQTSSRATLDEVNAILNNPNSTPTQRAFAASKKKEIESSILRADTQVEAQRQEQERQLTESQRGWRDQIDKQITDTDWLGTITGPKDGVDPNDYFEALKDIDSKAPFELRDYLLRLGLLVGRRGTGGLTLKRNIDPKLKEAVAQEIQRKLAEIDVEDWQGLSTSPYKDLRKYIPAGLFNKNK